MLSNTIQSILGQYDFNLAYAKELIKDVSDDQMCLQSGKGLVNHPAFTLGHLVTGSALTAKYLGESYKIPDRWEELFLRNGPGDPRLPEKNIDLYPKKEDLIEELSHQHEKVKKALKEADENFLLTEKKWRYSNFMPKLIDCVHFMCVTHEAMHLGQLAAWRRAFDMESALKRL